MIGIKRYFQAYKDYKKGNIGDAGYMEFKIYGVGTNPGVLEQLQSFGDCYPDVDVARLAQLPEGTLGRAYAEHMEKYRIQPLEISSDMEVDARQNLLALRLVAVHDIYHALLEFSTNYSGEAGVFAFKAAQGYSKAIALLQPIGLIAIMLMRPRKIKQTLADYRRGWALGKQAKNILTYRFEDNWAKPIDEVRAELGLILPEASAERNGLEVVQSEGAIAA